MTKADDTSAPGLTVRELWRFPVKSLQGEKLEQAEVAQFGIHGDRAWSLVDPESGLSLTARRRPELLMAQARLDGPDRVMIRLPDGTETDSDSDADGVLSRWLGGSVHLQAAADDSIGTYETQADETETGPWLRWEGPAGSFHDSTRTRLSLVSTATLGSWDRRRFRINVIADGAGEDGLVGQTLSLGSVRAEVTKHIDRCVLVTRPQTATDDEPALDRDPGILTTINRSRGGLLGIALLITTPGRIRIGDRIHVAV